MMVVFILRCHIKHEKKIKVMNKKIKFIKVLKESA